MKRTIKLTITFIKMENRITALIMITWSTIMANISEGNFVVFYIMLAVMWLFRYAFLKVNN